MDPDLCFSTVISAYANVYRYDICLSILKSLDSVTNKDSIIKIKKNILDSYCHYFCHSSEFNSEYKNQIENCNKCLEALFYIKDGIDIDPILDYDKDILEGVYEQLKNNKAIPNISKELKNVFESYNTKYGINLIN